MKWPFNFVCLVSADALGRHAHVKLRAVEDGRRVAFIGAAFVAVVGVVLVVFGQWAVRSVLNDGIVCEVTAASVAAERAADVQSYTGGDHPSDPEVGDIYACSSGGIPGERVCRRSVGIFSTRLVDCTTI